MIAPHFFLHIIYAHACGSSSEVEYLRGKWYVNDTLSLVRFQPGGVGFLPANAVEYLEYQTTWDNDWTASTRDPRLMKELISSSGDRVQGPSMRYVYDKRRYMPWQISNPIFMSLRATDLAAYSFNFLYSHNDFTDLTLTNGFCPSFHKKSVRCVTTTASLASGDTVKNCTASVQDLDCCTEAGHRVEQSLSQWGSAAVGFGADMDFELDVLVYTALKKWIPEAVYKEHKVGVTNNIGVAQRMLEYDEILQNYAALPVDHGTSGGTVLWLSMAIGAVMGISIIGAVVHVLNSTIYQYRLDLILADATIRDDAISSLRMCNELFSYKTTLDLDSNVVSKRELSGVDEDGNSLFAEINAELGEDVDHPLWVAMDKANLSRCTHEIDLEGDGTHIKVMDLVSIQWLQRAENLLLDLERNESNDIVFDHTLWNRLCCALPFSNSLFASKGLLSKEGGYLSRIGEREREKLDHLKECLEPLVRNLRFFFMCTQPAFLLELAMPHHTVKSTSLSFREQLYYTTMHEPRSEMGVILLQIVLSLGMTLPAYSFAYNFIIFTRDLNWGLVPVADNSGYAFTWHTISGIYIAVAVTTVVVSNSLSFGDNSSPAEYDRACFSLRHLCGAGGFVRTKTQLIEDGFVTGRATGIVNVPCLSRQCDRNVSYTFADVAWRRCLSFIMELANIGMAVYAGLTIALCTVFALWILLGVFVYPEEILPYAAGIVGVGSNVIGVYSSLKAMQDELTEQLTQALNKILRKVSPDDGVVPDEGADVAEEPVSNSLAEVDPDEVRALLRRHGFTNNVIVNVVIYSTVMLVLVLSFLYLGYTSVIVNFDMTNAIIASVGVLSTSGAIAKSNLPRDDGGRSLILIVNYLVDQWQKAQANDDDADKFVFDTEAPAFDTLHRAREFHQRSSEASSPKPKEGVFVEM